MPNMSQMMLVLDIDETLVSALSYRGKNTPQLLNKVPYVKSQTSLYEGTDIETTYTINKLEMKRILTDFLSHGGKVAFITAGLCTKEAIEQFFREEYGICLDDDFSFYNDTSLKVDALQKIAQHNELAHENVILMDNHRSHIDEALDAGFTRSIHADTNGPASPYPHDKTDGTEYIKKLDHVVECQKACQCLTTTGVKLNPDQGFVLDAIAVSRKTFEQNWNNIMDDHGEGIKTALTEAVSALSKSGEKKEPSPKRTQAVTRYAARVLKDYAEYKTSENLYEEKKKFKDKLARARDKCLNVLDDSLSRKVLRAITNFISHITVVGMVFNAYNKYRTGNWLFYRHTQARRDMKLHMQTMNENAFSAPTT